MMASSSGYATTAGFESVCEAMWLGKPALLVPAHVEQEINAQDAAGIGAGIVSEDFDLSLLTGFIPHYSADTTAFRTWVARAEELFVRHLTTLV
jgi:UDP-N-acetylglucosamine:LPS N-acetylglucosamine transferase